MWNSEAEEEDFRQSALELFEQTSVADPQAYYQEITTNKTHLKRLVCILQDDGGGSSMHKTTFLAALKRFDAIVAGWSAIRDILYRIQAQGESVPPAPGMKRALTNPQLTGEKRARAEDIKAAEQQRYEDVRSFFTNFEWVDDAGVIDVNKLFSPSDAKIETNASGTRRH